MSKLKYHVSGTKLFEAGVKDCALYVQDNTGAYPTGVAWQGITSINESPSGADANPFYADDIKYLNLMSVEEYGASIEAYTYPDEFEACDGSATIGQGVTVGQQGRSTFGLCYKTTIGNDVDDEAGYKIHLVYGCKAAPSEKAYGSKNESPDAVTFSWDITTTPVEVPGFKPSACITINSLKADATKLAALEEILYGRDAVAAVTGANPQEAITALVPRLPLPAEVIELMPVSLG